MRIVPEPPFADTLENLIDRKGLRAVVKAVVDVCQRKAEHVRSAWQDAELADLWERAARMLERCRTYLPRLP
jgi:hypothetical protein